jgi:signal transduction histidine kinase
VFSDGRVTELPAPDGRATTAVVRDGETLAVLVHDPALCGQRSLVDAVVAAARLALDNARLHAAHRAQLHELHASRARIVVAADAERRRIQRDLHDGVQHKLLAIAMLVERARRDPARLGAVASALTEVIGELRALSEGIYPPVLTEEGLAGAVERLAEGAPLPVYADVDRARLSEHVERAAYFVITEALANVYKHANASEARVRVDRGERGLVVEVSDDGVGGADPDRGTGLHGLHDRVGALNGTFRVYSVRSAGTRVVAELPCES